MPSAANSSSRIHPANVSAPHNRSRQSGVILPVALFVLVAATILTLGLVKTNMSSLRVGGASVVGQETQGSAELLSSNFRTRNPVVTVDPLTLKELPDEGRYERGFTPCSTLADLLPFTTIFDCRSINPSRLPAHTQQVETAPGVRTPDVQRIGCAPPPRSSTPTENNGLIKFNHNQILSRVENTFYGSQGAAGIGVGKLVMQCP
jgi:hypothetical protein